MAAADRPSDPGPAPSAPQVDVQQRTSMAAERTWLACWRTALTATAAALAVGRCAPELRPVAPLPYILLGCGYAVLALAMLWFALRRQHQLERSVVDTIHAPLPFWLAASF